MKRAEALLTPAAIVYFLVVALIAGLAVEAGLIYETARVDSSVTNEVHATQGLILSGHTPSAKASKAAQSIDTTIESLIKADDIDIRKDAKLIKADDKDIQANHQLLCLIVNFQVEFHPAQRAQEKRAYQRYCRS